MDNEDLTVETEPDEELEYIPGDEDESPETGEEPPEANADEDPDTSEAATDDDDAESSVEGSEEEDAPAEDLEDGGPGIDAGLGEDPLFYELGNYLPVELSDEEAELDPDDGDVFSVDSGFPEDADWDIIPDDAMDPSPGEPEVAPMAAAPASEAEGIAAMTEDDFSTEDASEGEDLDEDRDTPVSYELQGLAPGGSWQTLGIVDATETSAELAGLPSGVGWLFRVRAIFEDGTWGEWSGETAVDLPTDMLAPPTPSTPKVAGSRGVVTLTWDGMGSGGVKQPADYKHTVVWQSLTGAAGTWNNLGLLFGKGTFHIADLPYGVANHFSLSSRDLTGNESARSGSVSVTLRPLVEEPDIAEEIARVERETAEREQVIRDSVDGLTQVTDSTTSASLDTPGGAIGDRWLKWDTLGIGGKLRASWRWDGDLWVAESMDPSYLPKVDIGQGTFGDLDGDRLKVGTVFAEKLAVGNFTNMIPNGSFNNGLAGWTGSHATHSIETRSDGVLALKVVSTSANDEAHAYSEKFDVTPGEKLRISYDTTGTSITTGNAAIWAYGYDAAGAQISFNMGTGGASTPGQLAYEFVVPDRVVRMQVRPYTSKANAVGTYGMFANIQMRRMETGELLVDGSVTAGKVKAKAIEAGHMSSNSVSADSLDAGAITAKHTITGAKFQTTSTPSRGVEITSAGLKAFDGSGNVKVAINSNGTAEFAGKIDASSITGSTFKYEGTDAGKGYDISILHDVGGALIRLDTPLSTTPATLRASDIGDLVLRSAATADLPSRGYMKILSNDAGQAPIIELGGSVWVAGASRRISFTGSGTSVLESRTGAMEVASGSSYARVASRVSTLNAWASYLKNDADAGLAGLKVGASGNTYFNSPTTYNLEGSSSPNVYVTSGGWLYRATSKRANKLSVEEIDASADDRILSLRSVTWFDRNESEELAASIESEASDDGPLEPMNPGTLRRIPGMIAEEVLDAGLPEFLHYGPDGEVEGLQYDRLGVALIPVVARQRDRIVKLESKVDDLEARLAKLEALLAA